jgi:DNA topoisomerase-2
MAKKIEEKYQKLTDREHVLHRPYMYVGSTEPHSGEVPLFNGEKIILQSVVYNPAFLKIFDEILSNSVDEHRKNPKLNEVRVTFDLDSGEITVWDNGGIPVKKHPVHKEWIPEMIFSNLKAGSSFDDSKDRNTAGTNGVGATLTNIFSTRFSIKTCDGINKFEQVFTDNMEKRTKPKISKSTRGFTEIAYSTDLPRFKMKVLDENSYKILYKRCLDAAACNPKLKIKVYTISNGEKNWVEFKFKKFEDYIKLYIGENEEYFYEESDDWRIGFSKSKEGFTNTSFVNSVHTKDGGTHVDYITNQLISHLREMIKKKHKVDVKPNDIRNHLYVFIDCVIINPAFSSQTKEKLITETSRFKTSHEVTEKIARQVFKSEIIQSVLDWVERKQMAEERAELRKLNKNLSKGRVEKLIDAQSKGDRSKCVLGIYEGMSALSAVRKFRDTKMVGAYPLKGKFINVHELPNSKVIKNSEVVGLMGSIGLKLGESPDNLRYGKVYIYTDADPDGNSIAAQLINFFAKYWPELFQMGIIYKVMTPLVVAKKGNQVKNFYTSMEFEDWINKSSSSSWNIEYKKGLAALEDNEYEEIIKNPKTVRLQFDKESKESLEDWFGSDSAPRKSKLLNEEDV